MEKPQICLAQFHQLTATNSIAELYVIQIQTPKVSAHHLLELPTSIEPELTMTIQQYKNVFEKPHGLPPIRSHDDTIPLMPGSALVKVRPYSYPHSRKIEIEHINAKMLSEGIIQPSSSLFSSPMLFVKKKDGTWCFCTDYRVFNVVTIKDSFPMPTVDELLDELFGAQYFSKLDLRSGYHQILVSSEDRYKTTFGTHQGLYEWLVMPFGLSNAPATLQALMNSVFAEFLHKFVLVFFDDILIYSTTWNTHIQHLSLVLSTMQRHFLFAKLSKYSFGQTQIEYLGHVVSRDGVKVDETMIQAIKQWDVPTSIKQLRAFLGLASYYRKFIRNFAMLVTPLTDLLKKDVFHWSTKSQQAFDSLKTTLTYAPVLALPNFVKPFMPVTLFNDDKGPLLQPSITLDRRKIKRNGAWLSEILIQWKELPEEEAKREEEHEIQRTLSSL